MSESFSEIEVSGKCFICEQPVTRSEKVVPGQYARQTIISCSIERGDEKHRLLTADSSIVVHRQCRNEYTKPSNVNKARLRRESQTDQGNLLSPKRLRSAGTFDFTGVCILCCELIADLNKKPNLNNRVILNDSFKSKVEKRALSRKDKWGRQVFARICSVKVEEVRPKYHYACWKKFRCENPASTSMPGRPKGNSISQGMEIVYSYMEQSDDSQFSILELCEVVEDYGISVQTMKVRLKEHYGNDIAITSTQSKVPVVCFRSCGDRIIHDHWYQERKTNIQEEEERIMTKAGEIVRRSIEDFIFDNKMYNNPRGFMKNISEYIPTQLNVFLNVLTTKKSRTHKPKSLMNKSAVIAHCLISLVKPNSFLSPVLLSVATYIHQKIGSKSLIHMLSNLGLCATYHDLKVFEASIIAAPKEIIKEGTFVQFSFDNCDVNVNTIDGHGTFHNMSGIMCVTPLEAIDTPNDGIIKQKRISQSCLLENKGIVTALDYRPVNTSGLDCLQFADLEELFPTTNCDDFPSTLDVCWLVAKLWKLPEIPGWQGMLERLTCSEYCDVSRVIQLPFIMAPPSEIDTVYTSLMMAINEGNKINLKTIFVTFDLPLFMKAVSIVLSAPPHSPLQRIVVRLGGFHLLMSFLGTIGYIMADSGLDQLLSVVYAENSVVHILNGHAYSRAIRAHMLASTAISHLVLKHVHLTHEEEVEIKDLLQDFTDCPPTKQAVDDNAAVKSVSHKFKQELLKVEESGPTAKLWIQYLKMVTLVRRFIQAERTGNWELHLAVVKMMMPYFIASGHLHYSKACYIYLQLMSTLPQRMDPDECRTFSNGYCTVRRTNKFCSGTWTDMVIEQTANREFKVLGGVIRRGFTDEVLNAYVVTKPAFSDIVESLEDFSGVQFFSSEQHVDARDSRVKRDEQDVEKLSTWLETHDPFSSTTTVVVSVGSGVIGNDSINCHLAKEVGSNRLKLLVGHQFKDIKLKRSDNIRPLSSVNSSIKFYDKVVNIDPLILYQRMLLRKEEDLSYYFTFEIAPFPLSLFTNTGMRKNVKSALCKEFDSTPEEDVKEKLEKVSTYIIDGGHILHAVKWGSNAKSQTYQDVCNRYLRFVQNKYRSPVIVFDGYSDPDSVKTCEQLRRYQLSAPQIKITENTAVCTNQERFLANAANKQQLISMLTRTFREAEIEVRQSTGDADGLIVQSALEKSCSAIVTQDTDILVLLTALAPGNREILLIKPKKGCTSESVFSSTSLQHQHQNVKNYILLAHSFSGCDTTSSIYGKGKKQLLKLLETESGLANHVHTFHKPDANHIDVKKAGECILLFLYGSKDGTLTLNQLRFNLFQKSLKKSVARLESLPPTSDSAAQHSYRTYYQIQLWLGNKLRPEEWGWARHNNCYLLPIRTTIEPAPETILKLVSCSCKGSCSTSKCSCVKSGIKCSPLCRFCEEGACTNSKDPTPVLSVGSEIVSSQDDDGEERVEDPDNSLDSDDASVADEQYDT